MITISIADEMNPFIRELVYSKDKVFSRAMKSLGWLFRKKTQEGIKRGSPGGKEFAKRTPLDFRRSFDKKAPATWYGKLRSAISYTYFTDSGELHIGWRTSTAALVGEKQEQGFARTVTQRVRAKYASLGYMITKNVIDVPDRPFFKPMTEEMSKQIAPYVTMKVNESLNAICGEAKSRRQYQRYGG